jgi:hypothetical protein
MLTVRNMLNFWSGASDMRRQHTIVVFYGGDSGQRKRVINSSILQNHDSRESRLHASLLMRRPELRLQFDLCSSVQTNIKYRTCTAISLRNMFKLQIFTRDGMISSNRQVPENGKECRLP